LEALPDDLRFSPAPLVPDLPFCGFPVFPVAVLLDFAPVLKKRRHKELRRDDLVEPVDVARRGRSGFDGGWLIASFYAFQD